MTARIIADVFSKPAIVALTVVGVIFLSTGSTVLAAIALGIAAVKISKLVQQQNVVEDVQLVHMQKKAGAELPFANSSGRPFNTSERQELLAIEHYRKSLRDTGCERTLVDAVQTEAQRILTRFGANDASAALRRFRLSLPPLVHESSPQETGLADKIQEELRILHVTQKEMENFPGNQGVRPQSFKRPA